jgi:diguanylate cyclase (GGDEF)-like protein/PAS domain S-box-containing protein
VFTAHCRALLGLLLCCLLGMPAVGWAQRSQVSVVRVGVYNNPPKIFLDKSGQISGIFGDLLREIASQEDWLLQPVPCEWQDCLDMVEDGRIDLMPDVARTPEREARFRFSQTPALHSWSQVYRHPSQTVNSLLDLQGKRVAYLLGSAQQDFFAQLLDSFHISVIWVGAKTLDEAFAQVSRHEADVVLANVRYGDWRAASEQLMSTPIMFLPTTLHVVTGLNANPAWLQTVDRHLQRWQADTGSLYYSTLHRWGSPDVSFRPPTYWYFMVLLGVLLLALLAAAVAWLRREVSRQTQTIRANEARLNTILDSVDAAIFIKGPDLRYQYANRKMAEILGTTPDQVLGQRDEDFMSAQMAEVIRDNDQRVLSDKIRLSTEEVKRLESGVEHVYQAIKLPLLDEHGQAYALCGIATDVTEQREATKAIHRLAYFDPLTQLHNRRSLIDQMGLSMAHAQREGRNGALVFLDLDRFKTVNDLLGHTAGDELLRIMATRLGHSLRHGDILARIGGDEFVLLLADLAPSPEAASDQALSAASKLQACFTQPVQLAGRQHSVTASMGIALFSDARQPDDLLRWADMALYAAKAAGRNQIRFFTPDMQARAEFTANLLQAVRYALEQHEFVLHYQPQVNAAGQLCGLEALVRWQHPDKGLLSPGGFIPVVENTELMLPLGQEILHMACAQLAHWQQQPGWATQAHWRLAINISAQQFHHPQFVQQVKDTLARTGAQPHRIELEVTESLLIDKVDLVIDTMNQLQALGMAFSLDDFGTGYSSLGYLKRLPLHKIKIDQSFVRDLAHNTNSQAIVRTIVALSDSLELETMAEGVETAEQQALLRQLGCQQYQGYHFSHPLPAVDLQARWLTRV